MTELHDKWSRIAETKPRGSRLWRQCRSTLGVLYRFVFVMMQAFGKEAQENKRKNIADDGAKENERERNEGAANLNIVKS